MVRTQRSAHGTFDDTARTTCARRHRFSRGELLEGNWSRHVTETSRALDLDPDVFTLRSPAAIACSLKRSAQRSRRRKSDPFRSAMSMLVFYINRAGKNLSPERRRVLERAKDKLRALFGRSAARK